jgi:pimeloyl-ACP methyl ester carboxylesterase
MSLQRSIVAGAAATALTALAVHEASRAAERANPPRGRFVDLQGVHLHVMERGAGEPVLYLHGNGAMIEEVEATGLVDALSSTNRVIVPDRPGFGHSSRPRGTTWTPERQAEVMADLLDSIDPAPAVIVGHSWGTLVALALALDRPDRVRGLVLISGFYYPEARGDILLAAPAIPVLGDIMRYTVSPVAGWALAERIVEKSFAPNPVTPRFRDRFPIAMALRPWQLKAAAEEIGLMQSGTYRLGKRYHELTCPITFLAGGADQVVDPHRHTERLASSLPNASLTISEGVGHMLPHIQPAAVARAVRQMTAPQPAQHMF